MDKQLPDQVVDLVVNNIFKKNGIDLENAKKNITEEQKQMMKDLLKDLTQRVNHFVHNQRKEDNENK